MFLKIFLKVPSLFDCYKLRTMVTFLFCPKIKSLSLKLHNNQIFLSHYLSLKWHRVDELNITLISDVKIDSTKEKQQN